MHGMKQTLIAMLVAAVISALTAWTVNGWRLNAKIGQLNQNHALALTKASEAAAAETARMQKEKDDALAKAQETAQRNAAAAAAAGRERDRLRNELSASRAALANSTPASVVDYADTLTVVFEHCIREYLNMAAAADGHALDAQTLHDGWKGIAK